jgi:hypothetical protein
MSTQSPLDPRPLPDRPDLRHLKDQARDLHRAGGSASLADALFQVARRYGFASWPKLKAHVATLAEVGQLKAAIDADDVGRVRAMMTRNPALHRAPLGYGKAGPLTWAAECRVPWGPPSPDRLAMVAWMIANGSDVHQGGDAPLCRAALFGHRIPMMDLLVAHGADVNAERQGMYPIGSPCETVDPTALRWLLAHGADPNRGRTAGRPTALDTLIRSYVRTPSLAECIDLLLSAGGATRYDDPPVLDVLRGGTDRLAERLRADPGLVQQRWPDLDVGATGMRRLTLAGATLLHTAAEYGNVDAARLLLDHGADVNGRATVDASGVGGQTPIFHPVSQFRDAGMPVARLLVERGADLRVRATLPGHYERPTEFIACTPLGYARLFPGDGESETVAFLAGSGALD